MHQTGVLGSVLVMARQARTSRALGIGAVSVSVEWAAESSWWAKRWDGTRGSMSSSRESMLFDGRARCHGQTDPDTTRLSLAVLPLRACTIACTEGERTPIGLLRCRLRVQHSLTIRSHRHARRHVDRHVSRNMSQNSKEHRGVGQSRRRHARNGLARGYVREAI